MKTFRHWQHWKGEGRCILAFCLALIAGPAAQADSFLFTTDADFLSGDLNGLSQDPADQLQLGATGTTFPLMWIANAGEDTISKMDTDVNTETARYRTWLGSGVLPRKSPFSGLAPSRTGVDIDGNVYVANRTFSGGNRIVSVVKILSEGGIDRNGNGTIDTSTDSNANGTIELGEIMPVIDDNTNGIFDCDATTCESRDERIAWVAYVGNPNGLGRSLCVGNDGNIWVGMFNQGTYYKISSVDGSPMAGPIPVSGSPYGCAVDGSGTLWGANLSNTLTKLDTTPGSEAQVGYFGSPLGSFYGITVGKDSSGNTKVFMASSSFRSFLVFDPATNAFSTPASEYIYTLGISIDGDNRVVIGNTSNGIRKFNQDGSLYCSGPPQASGSFRGAVVDANNDIWLVHLSSGTVGKWSGDDCSPLGVFPVGYQPYTYSDVTGFAARNVTNPSGTWTQLIDSGVPGFKWDLVSYSADIPDGAEIVVRVRSADNVGDLATENYVEISNGVAFLSEGQYIDIQTRLTANTESETPILYDLTANGSPPNTPPVALCQDVIVDAPLGSCSAGATIDAGSFDPDGDSLSFAQSPAGPYGLGSTEVTLTVTEQAPAPGLAASCTAFVLVQDITPPTVDAGADTTLEATSPAGADYTVSPNADDGCGGVTVDIVPDLSTFPIGSTTVVVTATDEAGNQASDEVVITVEDSTEPEGTVTKLNDGELWPPNHKLVHVATLSDVSDIGDPNPVVTITVASNQPLNDTGDGNTDADWEVVENGDGTWEIWLMAERAGNIDGPRTYTVTIQIADTYGNVFEEICEFVVPHDQAGGNGNGGGKKK